MSGPLDRAGNGDPAPECDVIFTAVALGFCLTRVVQEQPFSFDADPSSVGNDSPTTAAAALYITDLLERAGHRNASQFVSAGVSPTHQTFGSRAFITGRAGGQSMTPNNRNRALVSRHAQAMSVWEATTASNGPMAFGEAEEGLGQYHSYGAYTGMIDDPIDNHTLIQPTLRRVIDDPSRWSPNRGALWGLIGTNNNGGEFGDNLSSDPQKGMGPVRKHKGIVQYVHGMSWAMREAIRWGPWCNAYEMAVGPRTTKRASCFACTTYMWANGFPASSSHLGRGESWGTLPDGTLGGGEDHSHSDYGEGEIEKAIARSMNIRWNTEIYHFLRQGARLLERHRVNMDNAHRNALQLLSTAMSVRGAGDMVTGGNLFLDALTWHENDAKRIIRTLSPGEG